MQSLVDGRQAEHIPIRDRGLQYGDGCFETVRVLHRHPILWLAHLNRLKHACNKLALEIDFETLEREVAILSQGCAADDAILKIIITRGEGGRGYGPPNDPRSVRILQLFSYTPPNTDRAARAAICQHRLSHNAQLAGIKHLNRLDQVLASAQIPADCDEGICLDQAGNVVEGCRSNLCLVIEGELLTPSLHDCGVEGVMLAHIENEFAGRGHGISRAGITREKLLQADEAFLCNSVFGVWPLGVVLDEHAAPCWEAGAGAMGEVACEIVRGLFDHVR